MSTHLSAACLRNTIDTPELVPPNGTDCCHQGEHTQGEPLMSTDNTMVQAEAKARKRKNNAGRRMKARNKNQKMREGPCESTSQEAKTIDQANGKESGYGQDARHTKEASAQLNGQEININKRNGEEDRALFIHESEVAAEQRAELCHVIKHEDDERIIEVEAPRVTKGDPYGTKWKKGKSRATKAQPASSGKISLGMSSFRTS